MFIYCIINNINKSESWRIIYRSPEWIKNKKAAINPINQKDNKCFEDAETVALNYEEIKKDWQRMTKIKPFINK